MAGGRKNPSRHLEAAPRDRSPAGELRPFMPAADVIDAAVDYLLGDPDDPSRPPRLGLFQVGGKLRFKRAMHARFAGEHRLNDELLGNVWEELRAEMTADLRGDAEVTLLDAMRRIETAEDRRVAVRAARAVLERIPSAAARDQAERYDKELQGWREPTEPTAEQREVADVIAEYEAELT